MIKLSILVLTVPNRIKYFYPKQMKQLIDQTKNRTDVELLSLFDNKKRSVGAKRQAMLDLVQGEYCVFIDDDDSIANNYVDEIMKSLYENTNCDCVVFDVETKVNNGDPFLCKFGTEFEYGYIDNNNHQLGWRGKPAHVMVYKSSIAKAHRYNDLGNSEDVDWVKRACLDIKHQVRINRTLYFYAANYKTILETASLSDEIIQRNIELLFNK